MLVGASAQPMAELCQELQRIYLHPRQFVHPRQMKQEETDNI